MVEVNSETDFVARNEQFQDMVRKIAALAAKAEGRSREAAGHDLPRQVATVEDHVKEMVATIGENMTVRRTAALEVAEGRRRRVRAQQGAPTASARSACWWRCESKGDTTTLAALGRQLAMHVAATNPVALDLGRAISTRHARARAAIHAEQEQGQAAAGARQDGRRAACARSSTQQGYCSCRPSWIRRSTAKHRDAGAQGGREGKVGAPVKIARFARYALGEGIEKKDGRFRRRGRRGGARLNAACPARCACSVALGESRSLALR